MQDSSNNAPAGVAVVDPVVPGNDDASTARLAVGACFHCGLACNDGSFALGEKSWKAALTLSLGAIPWCVGFAYAGAQVAKGLG